MTSPTTLTLKGVWCGGTGLAVAVGDAGTILRYDGTSWTKQTSGVTVALWGVWGSGPAAIYAAGSGGRILRYDGSQWSETKIPPYHVLRSVSGGGGQALVVGNGGTILLSGGGGKTWTAATSPVTSALYGVCAAGGPSPVFAVGVIGRILRGC
jgi:photosystem II stability/assembly factor-like uncharacterized protein